MFRSSTIIREIAMNLAKVIFMLKQSVKLRRYLLCDCVAACGHTTAANPGSPRLAPANCPLPCPRHLPEQYNLCPTAGRRSAKLAQGLLCSNFWILPCRRHGFMEGIIPRWPIEVLNGIRNYDYIVRVVV